MTPRKKLETAELGEKGESRKRQARFERDVVHRSIWDETHKDHKEQIEPWSCSSAQEGQHEKPGSTNISNTASYDPSRLQRCQRHSLDLDGRRDRQYRVAYCLRHVRYERRRRSRWRSRWPRLCVMLAWLRAGSLFGICLKMCCLTIK